LALLFAKEDEDEGLASELADAIFSEGDEEEEDEDSTGYGVIQPVFQAPGMSGMTMADGYHHNNHNHHQPVEGTEQLQASYFSGDDEESHGRKRKDDHR